MINAEFKTFYNQYCDTINRSVNLDISFRCPLQCLSCQRQKNPFKITDSDDISIDTYKMLLSYFNRFNFCGQISDPIYHPKFLEILELNYPHKNKNFKYHTTATRKKIDWWKEVFSYTDSPNNEWMFGLDGTTQEIAGLYRVNAICSEVLKVMKLATKYNNKVTWQYLLFDFNQHQLKDAEKICNDWGINLLIVESSRSNFMINSEGKLVETKTSAYQIHKETWKKNDYESKFKNKGLL